MRFVVDKVALGQILLRVLRCSSVGIFPPTLHTHLHIHVALTRRAKRRSLETFQKCALVNRGILDRKVLPFIL
jgi:hypothetical protein